MLENAKWIKSCAINTVPCFKKEVNILSNLKEVTLDITAMGFYRVYVNSIDITNNLFMPGYTSYPKRVQVQTYNLTSLFKKGKNVIDILLGNGWGGAGRLDGCMVIILILIHH